MIFTAGNDWLRLRSLDQFTVALPGIFFPMWTPVGLTTLTDASNGGHPPGRLVGSVLTCILNRGVWEWESFLSHEHAAFWASEKFIENQGLYLFLSFQLRVSDSSRSATCSPPPGPYCFHSIFTHYFGVRTFLSTIYLYPYKKEVPF